MILVIVIWLLMAVLEGMLYVRMPLKPSFPRQITAWVVILVSVVAIIVALRQDWQVWLLPSCFYVYRLGNTLRFLVARLPEPQLRSVSLGAHGWLIGLQTASLLLMWGINTYHLGHWLIGTVAGLQLVAALVLLRASLHTWRHAEPFRQAKPLTDRELPTLSVLIPARNETEALERCLEQLVTSDYPKLEIIVLDDNSTDRRTPEIIRSFAQAGVRFIQGAEPDDKNWLAKNLAYERLALEASGELLLFCGVDALFSPHTLRQLVEVLLYRQKDMLSVLPLKDAATYGHISLLQPMRYYWELCLPRRFFKRPPVLSTCWLIRRTAFERSGGFEAISRSVTPEAYFARKAVVTDAYSFIRSNAALGFYSNKPVSEQYDTSVRTRYPQLHRRLEIVAIVTALELLTLVGPFVGLCLIWFTAWHMAYLLLWLVCIGCLLVTYYLVAVATRLTSGLLAWLLMPFAFLADIVILHISFFKYEFSRVVWKGRDVAVPVMQVIPRLPKL